MNDATLHEILNEIDVSYNGRLELWDYFQVKRNSNSALGNCSTQRRLQNAPLNFERKLHFTAKGRTKMLNDSFGKMSVALR